MKGSRDISQKEFQKIQDNSSHYLLFKKVIFLETLNRSQPHEVNDFDELFTKSSDTRRSKWKL